MKATQGNVLVRMDLTQKERYKFSNGQEIYISRGHEYNLRLDNPNVAEVIHSEKIPAGSIVLMHHNAVHDTYKVFEIKDENVYSVPSDMIFLYDNGYGWIQNEGFVISQRIFKPYEGLIIGMQPELVKNRLYILKGLYEGKCVVTLDNAAYRIVYFLEGREHSIIRTRIREIVAEDVELGKKIEVGEYLVGTTAKDAAKLLNPIY